MYRVFGNLIRYVAKNFIVRQHTSNNSHILYKLCNEISRKWEIIFANSVPR